MTQTQLQTVFKTYFLLSSVAQAIQNQPLYLLFMELSLYAKNMIDIRAGIFALYVGGKND